MTVASPPEVQHGATKALTEAILDLAIAHALGLSVEKPLEALAVVLGGYMARANLEGRDRLATWARGHGADLEGSAVRKPRPIDEWVSILGGDDGGGGGTITVTPSPIPDPPPDGRVPRVAFPEAVRSLEVREPVVARSAEAVVEAYRKGSFALAGAANEAVADRVKQVILTGLTEGVDAREVVRQVGPWSHAYADTVWRNNLSGAYTAGLQQQAADPAIREVMAGFELRAVGDADTRPTHKAMSGTFAPFDHPIWNLRTPLLGHRCRCALAMIDRVAARRRGLADAEGNVRAVIPNPEVRADPGFGWRRA